MNTDPLAAAYHRMIERLRHGWERIEEAEQQALPQLQRSLEEAADTAVGLGELTREEAGLLATWVRRDLHDIAAHLSGTGRDLRDWLAQEVVLIEGQMLDLLEHAVDRARLELHSYASRAVPEDYCAGEVVGPGMLHCLECSEPRWLGSPTTLTPCSACQGTRFRR